MLLIIEKYLSIFFIYAFLGWAMETVRNLFITKKFVNRGFLIGPYCPIYGIGVSLLTALLSDYSDDIVVLFFMSMIICGSLEYFTSYIMEKIFKARWWDYHNRKFNINGRICLETLIPFGIAGVILIKFVNPFFLKILNFKGLIYILIVLCIVFIIDFIFSFRAILGFRKVAIQAGKEVKDNTEEITKKVGAAVNAKYTEVKRDIQLASQKLYDNLMESRERLKRSVLKGKKRREYLNRVAMRKLKQARWSVRRLADAFPNLEFDFIKNKKDDSK